ncbi:MAG: hypothetical protein Q9201_001312 [Fulgogasparrea decipioides]
MEFQTVTLPKLQSPGELYVPSPQILSADLGANESQRLFCESGGPNNQGEEVLHLPVIVEAAESSPVAAREAATRIRKFLSKDNFQRAYVQYNAIMLVRILADNPGKTFTTNLDSKFTATVKDLLRDGRDMSVQQILRETLDSFETSKTDDETLTSLREMWKKEKVKWANMGSNPVRITATHTTVRPRDPLNQMTCSQPNSHQQQRRHVAPPAYNQDQNYFARNHRPRGLPPPHELAQRIEEARTSSKLLLQVVQSTPPNEVLTNELIKEFVERCQSASRSVQGYINSENPPPDENTLLTLIETNDQLSMAMSRYQRAMLQARRMTGLGPSPAPAGGVLEMPANIAPPNGVNGPYNPPAAAPPTNSSIFNRPWNQPPTQRQHSYEDRNVTNGSMQPPSQRQQSDTNPFDDPRHETAPAPADYGLPPNTHLEDPPYQSTSTGSNIFGRRDESTRGYGGRTDTHADNDDDDEHMYRNGHTQGREPVQYRF